MRGGADLGKVRSCPSSPCRDLLPASGEKSELAQPPLAFMSGRDRLRGADQFSSTPQRTTSRMPSKSSAKKTAPLFLGIDTGGTYTDAVLWSEATGVAAKAKALTTRHDLAVGISGAVDAVLAQGRASRRRRSSWSRCRRRSPPTRWSRGRAAASRWS